MKTKRQHDRVFKQHAVQLSYERNSIKELASELGISVERIYKWRSEFREYGDASFQGHGVERLSDEGLKVKELQKKLRDAQMELEIFKKAIAVLHKSCCHSAISSKLDCIRS